MGRIVVSTNVTLDGISQDPVGDEGFELGGWFLKISDKDREAWAARTLDEAMHIQALLLGGRTYEWFARRWVGRPGATAERLNSLPKYVVRSQDGRSDWGPTTVLEGPVVEEAAALKASVAGDVVVYASYALVHTLLANDLIDEVRVFVFPHVLGSGGRLFHDLSEGVELHLLDAERIGEQLVHLSYDVKRSVQ
jgi:dihydrofolate reductase